MPGLAGLATTTRPRLVDALAPILAALEGIPARVVYDAKDVNPPCFLLQPPVIHFAFRGGNFTAEQTLVVIAANTNRRTAYGELSDLLVAAQEAIGDAIVTGRPVDVWTADQTALLPAYELTWTDAVRHTD